jgi:hypothetical protein
MTDFTAMRKNSGKASLEKLTNELSKLNTKQGSDSSKDTRFWYPNVDKAGNGYAVIRFLPSPGDEDVPFVRMFEHGFKGPSGQWYIENSLTTIGKQDPVGEYNTILWNMSSDDNSPSRKQARAQKRKLGFISNILVIEDKLNPENQGKVVLFKYGKKIFDKLNEVMNPQFDDEDPMNPFDFWSGANFKMKIRNVEGYRNYDKSEFSPAGPLFEDDSKMETIWKQEHSLQAFLDPSNFKSYEELKTKLNRVLGLNESGRTTPAAARVMESNRSKTEDEEEVPWARSKKERSAPAKVDASVDESVDEEDDDMKFFKKLAAS